MKPTILFASLLLAACGKSAAEAGDPKIEIAEPWVRETVAGQTGTAAYMRIANTGAGDDRLISVAAPPPAMAMIHETSSEGGVSRMRPIDRGLAIPAGQTASLEPGGAHVMIMGLGAPLKAGGALRLTLRFERSGEKAIEARVRSASEQ